MEVFDTDTDTDTSVFKDINATYDLTDVYNEELSFNYKQMFKSYIV